MNIVICQTVMCNTLQFIIHYNIKVYIYSKQEYNINIKVLTFTMESYQPTYIKHQNNSDSDLTNVLVGCDFNKSWVWLCLKGVVK